MGKFDRTACLPKFMNTSEPSDFVYYLHTDIVLGFLCFRQRQVIKRPFIPETGSLVGLLTNYVNQMINLGDLGLGKPEESALT